MCLNPEAYFEIGGGVGAQAGFGIINVDGTVVGGGVGGGNLCIEIPSLDFSGSYYVGTRDVTMRGRATFGWGFITKEYRHVLIRGNPKIIEGKF